MRWQQAPRIPGSLNRLVEKAVVEERGRAGEQQEGEDQSARLASRHARWVLVAVESRFMLIFHGASSDACRTKLFAFGRGA